MTWPKWCDIEVQRLYSDFKSNSNKFACVCWFCVHRVFVVVSASIYLRSFQVIGFFFLDHIPSSFHESTAHRHIIKLIYCLFFFGDHFVIFIYFGVHFFSIFHGLFFIANKKTRNWKEHIEDTHFIRYKLLWFSVSAEIAVNRLGFALQLNTLFSSLSVIDILYNIFLRKKKKMKLKLG